MQNFLCFDIDDDSKFDNLDLTLGNKKQERYKGMDAAKTLVDKSGHFLTTYVKNMETLTAFIYCNDTSVITLCDCCQGHATDATFRPSVHPPVTCTASIGRKRKDVTCRHFILHLIADLSQTFHGNDSSDLHFGKPCSIVRPFFCISSGIKLFTLVVGSNGSSNIFQEGTNVVLLQKESPPSKTKGQHGFGARFPGDRVYQGPKVTSHNPRNFDLNILQIENFPEISQSAMGKKLEDTAKKKGATPPHKLSHSG